MRKFLSILLCAVMVFSLSGCAKSMTLDEKAAVIKDLSSDTKLDELQTLYMTLDCFMETDEVKSAIKKSGLVVDESSISIKCGYDPSAVTALIGLKGDFLKVDYSGADVTSISYYSYAKNLTLTDNFAFSIKFPDFKEKRYDTKKEQFEFLMSYSSDDFEERNKIAVAARESWLNPISPEEKAKEESKLAKSTATTLDGQIFALASKSDKITTTLQEGINSFSQNKITTLELYDLSKTAKEEQSFLWSALIRLEDDNNKAYVEAVEGHIINNQSIAENLMKYLDKEEMKYLSDAKSSLESSSTYAISVVSERTKYLSSQGFNDDEIKEILSPPSESKK